MAKNLQFFEQKLIKVLNFMVWVSQEQPAARSSQAKPKSWLAKVPVGAENIKFGPKRVENRRFGPKQRPNESYGLSGPIRTTPEAKNGQKSDFLRETAPGGRPAAPSDPVS